MKNLIAPLLIVSTAAQIGAAGIFGIPSYSGSLRTLLNLGSAAGSTPSIFPSQFQPGGGAGKVVSNVNIYNGQPSYSVPLGALNARGLQFPLSLGYGGPVRPIFEADNRRGPTGWLGMGWSLSIPYIAVNHKGTYSSLDDVLFCSLGAFGGGQILQSSANAYYLSTNPYIKITKTDGTGEFTGQFATWTFLFPDGKKMVFGNTTNSKRTVNYNGNLIKASPFPGAPINLFVYRWDISSMSDNTGANTILFDYARKFKTTMQGLGYVHESQVSSIKWLGPNNKEAERFNFITATKGDTEFDAYLTDEPDDEQRLYETQYLKQVDYLKEGRKLHSYTFVPVKVKDPENIVDKSLLSAIKVDYFDVTGKAYQNDNGWVFTYDSYRYHVLSTVTTPDLRIDTYLFKEANFLGKDGDIPSKPDTVKRADHKTQVPLPTDNAQLAKWKNEARCDDRFCYMLVKDGDDLTEDGKKWRMFVEIRPNMGNFFDTASATIVKRFENGDGTTPPEDLDIIPGGDYFLVVNRKYGSIDHWEWNGVELKQLTPFSGDSRYTGNFRHRIEVIPGSNYYVVNKTNVNTTSTAVEPPEIIVVLRKADGTWSSLNRNFSACDFTNAPGNDFTKNYGEDIRAKPGTKCMEFGNSALLVSTAPSYFTVTYAYADVVLVYSLKSDGSGFTNISDQQVVIPGAQIANFPMNWQVDVYNVNATNDYYIVHTANATSGLHVFYVTGNGIKAAGVKGSMPVGGYQTYTAGDYIVDVGPDKEAYFWWKKKNAAGTLEFVRAATPIPSAKPTVVTDKNKWVPVVRAHPNAFTIEYYAHKDSIGSRPHISGSNYAVNLYEVKRNFNGYVNRTANLNLDGENLFNVSFSPADNQLFALSGTDAAGGTCGDNEACTFTYRSVRTHPLNPAVFVNLLADLQSLPSPGASAVKQFHEFVTGSRIGVRSILRSDIRRAVYYGFQWSGDGFGRPTRHWVVSRFNTTSRLSALDRDNISYDFNYDKNPLWRAEFNSNLQTPQFEVCEVKQANSAGGDIGGVKSVFHLDLLSRPLYGKSANLIGVEKNMVTFGASPDTMMRVDVVSDPYHASAWPAALFVNRLVKTTNKEIASNQSYRQTSVTYHYYNDVNGAPHFIFRPKSMVNPTNTNHHRISQSIYNSNGLPIQSVEYTTGNVNDTALLKSGSVNPAAVIKGQANFSSTLTPVNSGKTTFNSSYQFTKSESWRDVDQNLTTGGMQTGANPTFNLGENWFTAAEITGRNGYGQVTESRNLDGTPANGEAFASAFYEGIRSDMVATVSNAPLSNSAVLMAENGDAGLGTLDYAGRWENAGAAYSTNQTHTGKFSFKVVNHYGPTINIALKNVVRDRIGFRVSAWIFAMPGTNPVMAVERRFGNTSIPSLTPITGAPVDGWVQTGQWQRWEAVLSYNDLTASNYMAANGNNDFLRIWVGTGDPSAGTSATVIYVDDIVCAPSNASAGLATFDYRGAKTSATAGNHVTTHLDVGVRGGVMGIRDENYRIHGQSGIHRMGEN